MYQLTLKLLWQICRIFKDKLLPLDILKWINTSASREVNHYYWIWFSILWKILRQKVEISMIQEFEELRFIQSLITKKNLMVPFYGWGSTASRLEPLRGGNLLFTFKFPEIPGTHFIDLERMKDWADLRATQCFRTRDPWIENPEP